MVQIPIAKMRVDLSETVNRVAYAGERVVIQRRGRPLVAIIPVDDLELLENLEDEADVRTIQKARAEAKRKGEKPIPWAIARTKLGL